MVDRLRDALAEAPAVIVADFKGLDVEKTNELRSRFRAAGVSYEVVKNTLVKRAVADTPKDSMAPLFKGNSAIAFHAEDPAAPAKVLRDFVKDHKDALTLKGGWLDGEILDEAGVMALANLPGKDELRGRMLSVLIGVPTKFVRTLIAGPTEFVRVLQARKMQLEEG